METDPRYGFARFVAILLFSLSIIWVVVGAIIVVKSLGLTSNTAPVVWTSVVEAELAVTVGGGALLSFLGAVLQLLMGIWEEVADDE